MLLLADRTDLNRIMAITMLAANLSKMLGVRSNAYTLLIALLESWCKSTIKLLTQMYTEKCSFYNQTDGKLKYLR